MNEKMMKNILDEKGCTHAADLVTFLYGEATEREAKEFMLHMDACASCREEFAAFKRVREGVVMWRNQSLPSFESSETRARILAEAEVSRKPSALSALKAFFKLSPMWMRGATAMAVLVICALAVFTVAYFSQQPQQLVVERAVPTGPTAAEVQAMVEKRAAELRDKEKAETAAPSSASVQVAKNVTTAPSKVRRQAAQPQTLAKQQQPRIKTDKASAQEVRQQLAELVQSQKEEDSLPRLSDLIEESNDSN